MRSNRAMLRAALSTGRAYESQREFTESHPSRHRRLKTAFRLLDHRDACRAVAQWSEHYAERLWYRFAPIDSRLPF